MKIFLSYADQDQAFADQVQEGLTGHQHTVYNYRDPASTSSHHIMEDVERNILSSDAFFLLLSRNYLASKFCFRERELAFRVDTDQPPDAPGFIHVLRISPDPPDNELGFLRIIRSVDLTQDNLQHALRDYAARLASRLRATPNRLGIHNPATVAPLFRNRVDELQLIRNDLIDSGGKHFWLAVAPPQLGKSWFLKRLELSMPRDWRTSYIDLAAQTRDDRASARHLTALIFGVGDSTASDESIVNSVAANITKARRPYLAILDGGETLEKHTARQLRQLLSQIRLRVNQARIVSVRLGVVVASRRQDPWAGVSPPPSLTYLPLTEFNTQIVVEALGQLAHAEERSYSNPELLQYAGEIHDFTEGLPELVSKVLLWMTQTHWLELDKLGTTELSDEIVRPYVREQFLSLESLVPPKGDLEEERRQVVELALKALCTYRFFTLSHLRHSLSIDHRFDQARLNAGWSEEDLYQALGEIALVRQLPKEPWSRIDPAIRRLLFRYFVPEPAQQARAHEGARDFYERFRHYKSAEQDSIFVESLWHEATRLLLEDQEDARGLLLTFAAERAAELGVAVIPNTSMREGIEVRGKALRDIDEDEEVQAVLSQFSGLSDKISEIISSVSGEASHA